MAKTVGLVMIVKNEAKIIVRCLKSARPVTDYVLVVDTGSSDGTPEIIEAYVQTIPMGKLGDPEDLGALAVYLASDAARYMTGAALVIDGGYVCL